MSDVPSTARPAPRLGPGADLADFCRAWLTSRALADLVAGFGGQMPDPTVPEAEAWAWLEDFSTQWDYRGRKERNEAATPEFDEATTALVKRATRDLGIQDTLPPSQTHYDHVLILGGLARGCFARPLHAAALIADGAITADRVTALGAFRSVGPAERPLLAAVGAQGARTEFDVMAAGVRAASKLGEPVAVQDPDTRLKGVGRRVLAAIGPFLPGVQGKWATPAWRVARFRNGEGLAIEVVAAPSPEAGRRANTGETIEWLAANRKIFRPGQSVLVVTTFHYRLYQLADAIRVLGIPYGVSLDAVGVVPGEVDPRLAWMPSTSGLLQEVRSTIRSLRRLCAASTTA